MTDKIALLEYDCDPTALVTPDHEKLGLNLPPVAVMAFVGDNVDIYAKENNLPILGYLESITKHYPVYLANPGNKKICLVQAPMGAPASTLMIDWLIGYGVKYIIATGSCGVLEDIPENAFLLPTRALRDEGTSFHYLPPARYIDLDGDMAEHIAKVFDQKGLDVREITVWTTDAFFRETKQKVQSRKNEGCSAVDMECSALAACAKFRGVKFGQFFFTADSLHEIDNYDERDWGEASLRPALELALDVAAQIEE